MSSIGRGSNAPSPRQITQQETPAIRLESQVTQASQEAQQAARAPAPQDAALRKRYEKAVAKLGPLSVKFDQASTSAHKDVGKVSKGMPKDAAKLVGKKIGKAFAAVDKGGTEVNKAVKQLGQAAKSKPESNPKKKPNKKAEEDTVKKLEALVSTMEKVTKAMHETSKGIIQNFGV